MTEVAPLKRFVDPNRPITYGIVQAGPDIDGGVPYIRPVDMSEHDGVADIDELRTTAPEIAATYRRSAIRLNDLVVTIGPSYGKTMVVNDKRLVGANLTQGTARVAPSASTEGRYLRWALQSSLAVSHWDAAVGGATFRALNLGPLEQTPIPRWPIERQRAIADFLDAETARINALIAKKRRLAGLAGARLASARVRAFSHNPERRATAWYGAAPDDFRTARIGTIGTFHQGTTFPHEHQGQRNGDLPFVKVSDLWTDDAGTVIDSSENWVTHDVAAKLRGRVVPAGSVLYARVGAALALNPRRYTTRPCLVDDNVRAIFFHVGRPQFWCELLTMLDLKQLANPGPVPSVSESQVATIRVPVPSLSVQDRFVDDVLKVRRHRDLAQEKLRRQISLLRERRRALITAAVTGQMAVPGVEAA